MNTSLTTYHEPARVLVPAESEKDQKHRSSKYATWIDKNSGKLYTPDLRAYRDALLVGLQPNTVRAHLSTVRSRYADLVRDRDLKYAVNGKRAQGPKNAHWTWSAKLLRFSPKSVK